MLAERDGKKLRRSVADADDHTFGLVCGMSGGGHTSLSNSGCHQVLQGVRYCTCYNDSYPARVP